ncbi:MAG: hypothetical protein M1330_01340 [Armatimonadetes bacterium]|nr:hypothetical protein [Armatimonadota bacterium]
MAQKVKIGSSAAEPVKSVQNRPKAGAGTPLLRREMPRSLIIAVAAIVVCILAAGTYYELNGGWKTAAMHRSEYKHDIFPLEAAKKGFMEPLQKENARRKRLGLPLLQLPKSRSVTAAQTKQQLQQLRQKLEAKMGANAGGSQP